MAFAISLYEVSASIYIVLVVTSIILRNDFQEKSFKSVKECVVQGIPLLIVLICGIVVQTVVAHGFLAITGLENELQMGRSRWLSGEILAVAKELCSQMIVDYGVSALFYFPVTEVFIAGIINGTFIIYYLFKRNKSNAFLWFMLGIGSISLSLMQGARAPHRAIQQTFSIYTAFIFSIIYHHTLNRKNRAWFQRGAYMIIVYLIISQSIDLNKWEYVNYLRVQEEERVARAIGSKLEEEFDLTKPVVFVGGYQLSDHIRQYLYLKSGSPKDILARKIMDFFPFSIAYPEYYVDDYGYKYNQVHNAVLYWGVFAFGEVNTEILEYFRMKGYEFQQGTMEMYQEGKVIGAAMPIYPQRGYIKDCGEYILVNLGR